MIRMALPTDTAAIAGIWNGVIRDSIATFNSVEKLTAEISDLLGKQPFFIADDSCVVGFVTYSQFRGGIGYAHTAEHTIHLAPEAQGKGLGRALMAVIEDHARANGFHSMIAGISGENSAGIGFHAALDYAHVATVPEVGRKWDRWHDLVMMQKFL